jgi:hypothetical protein
VPDLQGYEPVMLMLRKDVPWFDERFRGPHGGRTAHALHTSRHMEFSVHPSYFVLQLPQVEASIASEANAAVFDQARFLWNRFDLRGSLYVAPGWAWHMLPGNDARSLVRKVDEYDAPAPAYHACKKPVLLLDMCSGMSSSKHATSTP